jgi:hypothetical protein
MNARKLVFMNYYVCPVCRAPKKNKLQDALPMKTHMSIIIALVCIVGTMKALGAGDWSFKLGLLYFPLWGLAELVHWSKQRQQTKCRACGFDPFLYQRDWRAARSVVEGKLNKIKSDIIGGDYVPPAAGSSDADVGS